MIRLLQFVKGNIDDGISINENELLATEEAGDTYQWWDCANEMMIEGATERTFSPETSGSYRVQIFKGPCSFFTDCITFTLVNTIEQSIDVKISPNPSHGLIYILGDVDYSSFQIRLFDVSGKEQKKAPRINSDGSIDISQMNAGLYLLRLEDGEKSVVKKIIVL